MKKLFFIIIVCSLISCAQKTNQQNAQITLNDSLTLIKMVKSRESAMIDKDINSIVQQFDSNATFINGGGFYYEGINEIKQFHQSMFNNDSLTYTYKIGDPLINSIQSNSVIVYYPWQQLWTMKNIKSDTLIEVGLMTIIAVKEDGNWKWKSITNQRTKEFFKDLKKHKTII